MVFGTDRVRRLLTASVTAIVLALSAFLSFGAAPASAAEPSPKRAYHASVLNGGIVGSAFMISDGVVVTNAHVVAGRRAGDKVTLIAPSGRRLAARVRAVSTQMDLAILSAPAQHLTVAPPARPQTRRGAQIIAIGIVARSGRPGKRLVIRGTVSSDKRALKPYGRGVIARMPLVQKGFSGGPVFDTEGNLVGMVAALRSAHRSPSGGREAFILTAADINAEVRRLFSP